MRVALITSSAPYGRGERFVVREAVALQAAGVEVIAFPVHQKPGQASTSPNLRSRRLGMVGPVNICAVLRALISRRGRLAIAKLLRADTRPRVFLKNLATIPFACRLASEVQRERIDHIHAAWISIPASAAFVASELTSTPWSFSAHRWDIVEGNAAALKISSATFARTISGWGRERLGELAPNEASAGRVHIVHLGVAIPSDRTPPLRPRTDSRFTVVTIGNLIPVKGHTYLLRACAELARRGVEFRLRVIGDGPLRAALEAEAKYLGIRSSVEFCGQISGWDVDEALSQAHASVLASVTTSDGEHEGIPSSLIESMVAGVPVVATRSGAIPELVCQGCGVLVPERDAVALAHALVMLSSDEQLRHTLSLRGRQRVECDFNESQTTHHMLRLLDCWPVRPS